MAMPVRARTISSVSQTGIVFGLSPIAMPGGGASLRRIAFFHLVVTTGTLGLLFSAATGVG